VGKARRQNIRKSEFNNFTKSYGMVWKNGIIILSTELASSFLIYFASYDYSTKIAMISFKRRAIKCVKNFKKYNKKDTTAKNIPVKKKVKRSILVHLLTLVNLLYFSNSVL
jgi:hypothetical protein